MYSFNAYATQKAKLTGPTCTLPGRFIFEMSRSVRQILSGEQNKETLFKSLRQYAYSKRRGKLRLPQQFIAKLRALTKLSKTQVRQCIYWLKAGTCTNYPLDKRQLDFVKQHSAVPIWNRNSKLDFHMANSVGLNRLSKRDAPRCTRALWPSAPTFSEMQEMIRRDVLRLPNHKDPSYTATNCLTRKSVSDDIRLATKIVAKNIIGIRSSFEIPEEFLPWFRYRHGFSILSVRHKIPAGLVRFLLAHWVRGPNNLWLLEHCNFKKFLRRHTADDFVKIVAVFADDSYYDSSACSEVGNLPPSGLRLMSDDDMVAELGDDFKDLIARLPG